MKNLEKLINMYNEKCEENNCMADIIYNMNDIDKILYGLKPSTILFNVENNFNRFDDYFIINGMGRYETLDNNEIVDYIKLHDDVFEYNIIKLNLLTGSAWTSPIYMYNFTDDLMQLLDEAYFNDLIPIGLLIEPDEIDSCIDDYIGLNGGEMYIQGISHIEEISLIDAILEDIEYHEY